VFEEWRLADFAPGEGEGLGAFAEGFDATSWIRVDVPGDVHQALVAAGRIPDPYWDRNELECAWVEDREWWYRTRFTVDGGHLGPLERLLLVFQGLDTFVTIWLNGELAARHGNMFREAVVDISRLARTDQPNALALRFEPPLLHVADRPSPTWEPPQPGEPKRNAIRKAQFGWGWDWGPRLPTIGIWRPVEVLRQEQAAIRRVRFNTLAIGDASREARLSLRVEIEPFAGNLPVEAEFLLQAPDGATSLQKKVLARPRDGGLVAEMMASVEGPRLWWPHDLGDPALYLLQVRLLQGGRELDRRRLHVGIRSLSLDQSPDPDEEGARFFRFVVNGTPIFARGADWIPASSFPGALTADRYEMLLTSARDAGMNMLRVWGGGIYEHDVFYDLCDRLGILIWQDFMFACAPYPEDDPTFVAEVRSEIDDQVSRLRNHPSLALWCGNNENQWLHSLRAFAGGLPASVPGTLYYDEIMPQVVRDRDGFTPYWPGSPWGGPSPNSVVEGDVHDWHVWHGLPVGEIDPERLLRLVVDGARPEDVAFSHYAEDRGRFISEFGMHASPVFETLRRCIPPDQLYHHSPAMDHHNKDNPKTKGDNLMRSVTGLPKDLQEYIDFSMIAQAEGLKFGIEHFRRRKPHCSGTLIWQLNDCWPVLSWSILDYYGFGKAGYFYVRRAYAPLLASFQAMEDGSVELWLTNDTLEEVTDTAVIRLGGFAGETIWEERFPVRVSANSSRLVWRVEPGRLAAGADRYLAVRSSSGRFRPNRHFFAAIQDLVRHPVEPEVRVSSRGDHELSVDLCAPAYLFYVHLIVPDEHTRFSDNYFDLIPGETRTVVVTNPRRVLTPEAISVHWR